MFCHVGQYSNTGAKNDAGAKRAGNKCWPIVKRSKRQLSKLDLDHIIRKEWRLLAGAGIHPPACRDYRDLHTYHSKPIYR